MEKLSLTCPKCHGTMELNESKTEMFCPYCRNKVIIEDDIDKKAERIKKITYAREEGERLAEEAAQKRNDKTNYKKKIKTRLIIFGIIAVFLFIGYRSYESNLEYVEDPFSYIDVSFSGVDNLGEAKISHKDNYKVYIDYSISKDTGLSEGEKVTVTAKSSEYRLGIKSKEYTVEGLLSLLLDLNDLTSDMKDYIHKISYDFQKQEITGTYSFKGELVSLEPYKFYLSTDGKTKNYLYDVYLAKIKAGNGETYDRYVVTRYEKVVITNNEDDLVRYSSKRYIGNLISAGNPSAWSQKDGYVGNIWGFYSSNELESFIKNNESTDATMKVYSE